MAYRKLKDGDLVRVVDGSDVHGYNGVVIDAGERSSYVQVNISRHKDAPVSKCKTILNNWLMIRNSPSEFIVDGRVDIAAQDKYNADRQLFRERNDHLFVDHDDDELEEACGTCSCCDWHNANN